MVLLHGWPVTNDYCPDRCQEIDHHLDIFLLIRFTLPKAACVEFDSFGLFFDNC